MSDEVPRPFQDPDASGELLGLHRRMNAVATAEAADVRRFRELARSHPELVEMIISTTEGIREQIVGSMTEGATTAWMLARIRDLTRHLTPSSMRMMVSP